MVRIAGADVVPKIGTEELFVAGDTRGLFGNVCDIIESADRTVINLECVRTTMNEEIKKFGPCLNANPKSADTLKELGTTDVMLANEEVISRTKEKM